METLCKMYLELANVVPNTCLSSRELALTERIASLEKTASEALQECERLRVIASDAWDAIIFYSDNADLMPDRIAELLERIRPYRAPAQGAV